MRRLTWLMVLAWMALPAAARAQVADCEGFTGVTKIEAGNEVARPKNFSLGAVVSVVLADGKPPENAIIKNVDTKWSSENIAQLRALVGTNEAFLVWTQLGQPACRYRFVLAPDQGGGGEQTPPAQDPVAVPPSSLSPTVFGRRFRADECVMAGQEWVAEIATGPRRASVLLFNETGQLCYPPPLRPRQGDAIHVGIFTSDPAWSAARITLQPCLLESATPNVLATGRLSDIRQLQTGPQHRIFAFPVRHCWNSPVGIEIVSADGNRRINYSLEQVTLYRATLHLGTVFTENHEVTFGLRPEGDVRRIFAQGPVDKGPEYVAALVFYSLPRYFMRGGFHGRDPVADTGWKDRVGGVIGVGLRNPTKRFITGFSVEIAAGVNAIGIWDWVETQVLAGVSEGDLFTGRVEEIPTRKEWRQKFVLGVTLDLVYAITAFRR